uniref:Uncharacterized protein n=1 Tax=Oryza meridionalis TaxID=40149 RepID=A0A0E0EFF5_9ORYZ
MVGYANVGDAPALRTQAMRSQEGQSHGTPPPQGTPWFECRNKVHRPRDSYNSEALCKLGSYLDGI